MSSANGSLPRLRYSAARRAAIVGACASVLTGTALALPAATFADDSPDPAPIVSLGVAGTTIDVPDVGVPLPPVELDTDNLPIVAPVTAALGLTAAIDTAPQPADTQPGTAPGSTAPGSTAPGSTAPGSTDPATTDPITAQPGNAQPSAEGPVTTNSDKPVSDVPSDGDTAVKSDVPADVPAGVPAGVPSDVSAPGSGRAVPATAVAGAPAPGSRLVTAAPTADQAVIKGVLEIKTQKRIERAAVVRAAQVLGTEKAAPVALTKDGLGLAAPFTDLGSRKVDSLNLAAGNGPAAATGDWNLLPEALYAVIPLLMAGAAVIVHNRRNARVAAASVGVIQRRRHAAQ
jgi:hypothetical protein